MQAIALRPQRGQIAGQMLGLILCVVGMLLLPALCVPLALLLPLFACPLMGLKQQWAALIAALAPCVISLFNGMDWLYAASLLLIGGLPIVTAELLRVKKRDALATSALYYMAAYAAALLAVTACAARIVGVPLWAGLAQYLTTAVKASPNAGALLYQLASAGLAGAPENYRSIGMLTLAMDSVLVRQMLMSLRVTLEALFSQSIPMLFVQACVIGGLFSTLRVQKLRHAYLLVGEKGPEHGQVHIAISPGFSMIQLAPSVRWPVMLAGLGALLLSTSPGSYAQQLSLLMYTMFLCVFELLGAAVFIGLMSARHAERKTVFGTLAAILYVIFPMALFLLGILDSVFHFRTKAALEKEEESL